MLSTFFFLAAAYMSGRPSSQPLLIRLPVNELRVVELVAAAGRSARALRNVTATSAENPQTALWMSSFSDSERQLDPVLHGVAPAHCIGAAPACA